MHSPPTDTDEEDRRKADKIAAMFALEVLLVAAGMLMLIAGVVLAGSTAGVQAARVPGYPFGLHLIDMAAITFVGAGALHFHRRRIEDRRPEMAEIAALRAEILKLSEQVRVLGRIEEKESDQVGAARRRHDEN